MTDKIKPALSARDWQRVDRGDIALPSGMVVGKLNRFSPTDLAAMIAGVNHLLPDSDPRKITREILWELRSLLDAAGDAGWVVDGLLEDFADALESYLPPDGA